MLVRAGTRAATSQHDPAAEGPSQVLRGLRAQPQHRQPPLLCLPLRLRQLLQPVLAHQPPQLVLAAHLHLHHLLHLGALLRQLLLQPRPPLLLAGLRIAGVTRVLAEVLGAGGLPGGGGQAAKVTQLVTVGSALLVSTAEVLLPCC